MRTRLCHILLLPALLAPFTGLAGVLNWQQETPQVRSAAVSLPASGKTGFTLLPPEQTGVFFTNLLPQERHLTNQILLNGSGVTAGDVDGDGLVDLYFSGFEGCNRLYRNLGNFKFEDITEKAGLAMPNRYTTGAVLADLDGDGDLDLIVNSYGDGVHIYFNDGQGHFTESTNNPGLNKGRCGLALALADFDGDGTLDLFIGNYRMETLQDQPDTKFTFKMVDGKPIVNAVNGRPLTEPDLTNRFVFTFDLNDRGGRMRQTEYGEPNLLCRNDGHGRFTPVSWTDGTLLDENGRPLERPLFDCTLSVTFRDLNGDGWPDLYTCSDYRG
ncbi:MAG: VCBS repeat-containing protein, partial [Verrucomicrobia bacterium]|nr:VCBS repeat-containing protein [Verrucomicrobiota bacterium]